MRGTKVLEIVEEIDSILEAAQVNKRIHEASRNVDGALGALIATAVDCAKALEVLASKSQVHRELVDVCVPAEFRDGAGVANLSRLAGGGIKRIRRDLDRIWVPLRVVTKHLGRSAPDLSESEVVVGVLPVEGDEDVALDHLADALTGLNGLVVQVAWFQGAELPKLSVRFIESGSEILIAVGIGLGIAGAAKHVVEALKFLINHAAHPDGMRTKLDLENKLLEEEINATRQRLEQEEARHRIEMLNRELEALRKAGVVPEERLSASSDPVDPPRLPMGEPLQIEDKGGVEEHLNDEAEDDAAL